MASGLGVYKRTWKTHTLQDAFGGSLEPLWDTQGPHLGVLFSDKNSVRGFDNFFESREDLELVLGIVFIGVVAIFGGRFRFVFELRDNGPTPRKCRK